jgi:alkylhydroperoxidase family enzyme
MLPADEARRAGAEAGMPEFISQIGLFRTLLVHEPLAKPLWGMVRALLREGRLDPQLRELVIMRVAWRAESAYEWGQHWRASLHAGLGQDKLSAVRDWRASDLFSPAEMAALAAADDVLDCGVVRPATWETCAREFPHDRDRVELLSIITLWQMVAVLLRSLQVPLDPDLDVWPPDYRTPA